MRTAAILTLAIAAFVAPGRPQPGDAESPWCIVAHLKGRTLVLNPADEGAWRQLPDQEPRGVLSPDGSKVAFIGSPRGGGFELFVADAADRGTARAVTKGAGNVLDPRWMSDGAHLVFTVAAEGKSSVHIVDAAAPEPAARQISAPDEHAINPRPGPNGRIAYVNVTRAAKMNPGDLVLTTMDASERRTLLRDTPLSAIEWSPDGSHLACSSAGSLLIIDAADGSTHEMPYGRVDERLYAHYAPALAWRPDGCAIALRVAFAGGRLIDPTAPPPPKPFWDGKVLLLPIAADRPDPAAATWIDAPDDVLDLSWMSAAQVPRDEPLEKD